MIEPRNRVVQVGRVGDPEGLEVVDVPLPTAGWGVVRVRVASRQAVSRASSSCARTSRRDAIACRLSVGPPRLPRRRLPCKEYRKPGCSSQPRDHRHKRYQRTRDERCHSGRWPAPLRRSEARAALASYWEDVGGFHSRLHSRHGQTSNAWKLSCVHRRESA